MKNIALLIVFSISVYTIINAQAPNWQWAKTALDSAQSQANGISTDRNGNVYVTGNYYFGGGLDIGTNVLSGGNMFIAKYDSSGNALWAKSNGAPDEVPPFGGQAFGNAISTDANNNVFVVGSFHGFINFVNVSLLDTIIGDAGFILKYNSSGTVLWGKSIAGNGTTGLGGVCTDANGTFYVIGEFTDTLVLGSNTLINHGFSSGFIAKYDSSGNILWAKDNGGGIATKVCTDANGNVYVIGGFNDTIILGNDTLYNVRKW